ncbi:unnamed protein product [Calicophoron daubneyi]|uniref:Protein kinase domain-containing protein n=1 Tax=Calicophoron daubneyi TaxID=300641 RepID=A0AAV2TVA6_CALDB
MAGSSLFLVAICPLLSQLLLWKLSSCGQCFGAPDILEWNRSLNYNNHSLVLQLEFSDDPAHWVVNYIFEILAAERLGYRTIKHVHNNDGSVRKAIKRLKCSDSACRTLPDVHVNLLVWLPIGVDVSYWVSPSSVSDHGPLGLTRHWHLFSEPYGGDHSKEPFSDLPGARKFDHAPKISQDVLPPLSKSPITRTHERPIRVDEWKINGTTLELHTSFWPAPPLCSAEGISQTHSDNRPPPAVPDPSHSNKYCRTESYQATKLSWAKLKTISPQLYQLTSRIHLSDYEFSELLEEINRLKETLHEERKHVARIYHEAACRWLRLHSTRWKEWTHGWNHKLNLTIAGMFSLRGKWVLSGLDRVAEEAVQFINNDPDYFLNTEYALRLDVRNLSCEPGLILNDYFKILAGAADNRLIGSVAALCPESIEAVVELANFRQKLIVSPTVATARFLEQQYYPYFFRTVPSMTQANYILLHLFLKWGWRRMVVFRKTDHFFNPRLFQANGIEIIADFEMNENQLTYKGAKHTLEQLKQRNSRIFVVEYGPRGTFLILCAAYHEGMHFGAGYVWFLNPWLSERWWLPHTLSDGAECTVEQMANITSWTFTVGHQLLHASMVHSFTALSNPLGYGEPNSRRTNEVNNGGNTFTQNFPTSKRVPRDVSSITHSKFSKRSEPLSNTAQSAASRKPPHTPVRDPMQYYAMYTYEAVILLASAMVHLLKENPSAISALDDSNVARSLRDLVSRTNFAYKFRGPESVDGTRGSLDSEETLGGDFLFDFGFQTAGEFYGIHGGKSPSRSQLRFNKINERVADYWLLKQRQVNTTVPIIMWYTKHVSDVTSEQHTEMGPFLNKQSATKAEDLVAAYKNFLGRMGERPLDVVNWNVLGGPPHDGSITDEECSLKFLSDTLHMGCTGSIVFLAVIATVLFLIPVVWAVMHYRRKLREAEKRTRKPFEELCLELADLDMPVESIVLNRQIGQGAFGLVFGGEAKKDGSWEAVAVKVINEKATYEGKIEFLSEAKLMRSLNHRNVIRLIGISLNPKDSLYLVMELMLLGDLKTYLLSRRILAQRSPDHEDVRPTTLTSMARDIAEGISYLHSKNLLHRDIACRNCLVGADHVVRIGDFGLTREATRNTSDAYYRFTRNCQLPIRWMPPEAVQFGIFTVQSDVWSYGITLYEIITFGVFPYNDMGDVEVVERVKRMEFSITEFLPYTAIGTVVWRLINQCCQHQWKNRLSSMSQVIDVLDAHPECIRPFLTDDPPKPDATMDSIPFQPSAGAAVSSLMGTETAGDGLRSTRSVPAGAGPMNDDTTLNYDIDLANSPQICLKQNDTFNDSFDVRFPYKQVSSQPQIFSRGESAPFTNDLSFGTTAAINRPFSRAVPACTLADSTQNSIQINSSIIVDQEDSQTPLLHSSFNKNGYTNATNGVHLAFPLDSSKNDHWSTDEDDLRTSLIRDSTPGTYCFSVWGQTKNDEGLADTTNLRLSQDELFLPSQSKCNAKVPPYRNRSESGASVHGISSNSTELNRVTPADGHSVDRSEYYSTINLCSGSRTCSPVVERDPARDLRGRSLDSLRDGTSQLGKRNSTSDLPNLHTDVAPLPLPHRGDSASLVNIYASGEARYLNANSSPLDDGA